MSIPSPPNDLRARAPGPPTPQTSRSGARGEPLNQGQQPPARQCRDEARDHHLAGADELAGADQDRRPGDRTGTPVSSATPREQRGGGGRCDHHGSSRPVAHLRAGRRVDRDLGAAHATPLCCCVRQHIYLCVPTQLRFSRRTLPDRIPASAIKSDAAGPGLLSLQGASACRVPRCWDHAIAATRDHLRGVPAMRA